MVKYTILTHLKCRQKNVFTPNVVKRKTNLQMKWYPGKF